MSEISIYVLESNFPNDNSSQLLIKMHCAYILFIFLLIYLLFLYWPSIISALQPRRGLKDHKPIMIFVLQMLEFSFIFANLTHTIAWVFLDSIIHISKGCWASIDKFSWRSTSIFYPIQCVNTCFKTMLSLT